MRGRMRDPNVKSYAPAFELGKPLSNYGVGLVIRSEHPDYKSGNHVRRLLWATLVETLHPHTETGLWHVPF
jgi:NADPH-dependent curcumin reductase CurA